jgi:SNF2 family DNA or RNA helicase
MPELPELTILTDHVHLPRSASDHYHDMEKKLFAELDKKDIVAASAAVATGKLAQIVNGFLYDDQGKATHLHTAKLDWLDELITSLDGEPLMVVYEYIEDRERILKRYSGTPVIGGSVLNHDALDAIRRWNAGELPLLLIHPASAGHGLNLQSGGSRMAWFSPTWSPELWDQTIGRLHRPGQKQQVMVHVCVVPETVDTLKRYRVVAKMTAQEAFIQYLRERQLEVAA